MTAPHHDQKDGVLPPKGKEDLVDVYSVSETQSTLEAPSSSSSKPRGFRSLFHRKSVSDESKEPKEPKRKEKRESISDRGAFRIEYRNGVAIAVENTDWPPGVSYEKTSLRRQLESKDGSLGEFYSGGAIVAGGENAANIGPDPDWIPGLSEEERKKLRSGKSGRYVF